MMPVPNSLQVSRSALFCNAWCVAQLERRCNQIQCTTIYFFPATAAISSYQNEELLSGFLLLILPSYPSSYLLVLEHTASEFKQTETFFPPPSKSPFLLPPFSLLSWPSFFKSPDVCIQVTKLASKRATCPAISFAQCPGSSPSPPSHPSYILAFCLRRLDTGFVWIFRGVRKDTTRRECLAGSLHFLGKKRSGKPAARCLHR